MPRLHANALPTYRLHKQSGQAIVSLSGKDHLLGRFGSAASRNEYDRLIAEWLANGRRPAITSPQGITVSRVITEFWAHAKSYYVNARGEPSKELANFRMALKLLRKLYGATPASEFGPLALKALQQEMIQQQWSRKYINRQTGRIKQVFKWAVSQELIPPAVHQGLGTVCGLRKGKTTATEYAPIKPVTDQVVASTLPHLSPQVQALVELQLLTGMRPGEAVIIRGGDLDQSDQTWIYRPHFHKTEHHGIERKIRIGPQAQAILKQFWKSDPAEYLFSPADAELQRRREQHRQRKTPLSCGNVPGSHVAAKPQWQPNGRYTTTTYLQAVTRACDKAFPPPEELRRLRVQGRKGKGLRWETMAEWRERLGKKWCDLKLWVKSHRWHPNQLRHTAATRLRQRYGIDVAQSILGHQLGSNITEVYAEVDDRKVAEIMAKEG